MLYVLDTAACVDALGWNQCAVNNGGCSHLCIANIDGRGHHCACPTHYSLSPDNVTCLGMCFCMFVCLFSCVTIRSVYSKACVVSLFLPRLCAVQMLLLLLPTPAAVDVA